MSDGKLYSSLKSSSRISGLCGLVGQWNSDYLESPTLCKNDSGNEAVDDEDAEAQEIFGGIRNSQLG